MNTSEADKQLVLCAVLTLIQPIFRSLSPEFEHLCKKGIY